jgi:hypothetical protein
MSKSFQASTSPAALACIAELGDQPDVSVDVVDEGDGYAYRVITLTGSAGAPVILTGSAFCDVERGTYMFDLDLSEASKRSAARADDHDHGTFVIANAIAWTYRTRIGAAMADTAVHDRTMG